MSTTITASAPSRRQLPGPPRTAIPRLMRGMLRNRLEVMEYVAGRYGDAARLPLGPKTLHVFNHPDYAKHVLADNAANYVKGIGQIHARRVIGNGLLTSEGELWRKQRKAIQPVLQGKRIGRQLAAIAEEAEDFAARLRDRTGAEPVDIRAELTGLALGVLGRTLIDADLGAFASIGHSFEVVQDQALFEVMTLGSVPLWVPLPRQIRFRRAKKDLQNIVDTLAADGATRPDSDDIIARLLDSIGQDEDPQSSRTRIHDELVTLLLAGHETTASTMSWAFYLLDQNPEALERVHDEAVQVLGQGPLDVEALHRLTFTTKVLQETLRLYPPVWLLPRIAKEDDDIGGYHVPAGADVLICPYLLHRHPRHWPDPERFDPERFDPARHAGRDRYAYIPFGAGPRFCVGNNLGMMEATIVLATVARDLRLKMVPGYEVVAEPMLTLRARGGLPMTVHRIA
jgi:enediyne biosynthesis protein E7